MNVVRADCAVVMEVKFCQCFVISYKEDEKSARSKMYKERLTSLESLTWKKGLAIDESIA